MSSLQLEVEGSVALTPQMAQALDKADQEESERILLRLGTATGKHWICKRTPHHAEPMKMKAKFTTFGGIEIDGQRYDYDVVIDGGQIRKRAKKASKAYREAYGHTPLSVEENLPWGDRQLIVGTGMYGRLPVMPEVRQEAARRKIELVIVPTEAACRMLADRKGKDVYAVLHVTC